MISIYRVTFGVGINIFSYAQCLPFKVLEFAYLYGFQC